jgi:hypothetical protein
MAAHRTPQLSIQRHFDAPGIGRYNPGGAPIRVARPLVLRRGSRMLRVSPVLLLLLLMTGVSHAQTRPRSETATVRQSGPPHAWLFGTWTGGLFPVLSGMAAQDCRSQPTVAFARDVVGHASLTVSGTVQRVIETVRTTPEGAEFRFAPSSTDPDGFGCGDPNVLHVARDNGATIAFPHCAAFPYPLERCPR